MYKSISSADVQDKDDTDNVQNKVVEDELDIQ